MTRGDLKQYLRANNKAIEGFYELDAYGGPLFARRFILVGQGEEEYNDKTLKDYIASIGLDLYDICSDTLSPQEAMDEGLVSFDQFENK